MKNLLVAIVVLSLTTISCTKSQDSLSQSNDSEIQTRKRGGSGSTSGGIINSIPAPTGLTATATGGGQVSLQWDALTGATSYWVYRDNLVLSIVTTTSFVDAYAGVGTHSYAVAAVVNSTLGSRSAAVSVTSR